MPNIDGTLQSNTVLIVGGKVSKGLLEALRQAGLETVRKLSSSAALVEVRHRSYLALVITDAGSEQDFLEIVLSIRDFDKRVPVVILGDPEGVAEISGLLKKRRAYLLSGRLGPQMIVSHVLRAIESR